VKQVKILSEDSNHKKQVETGVKLKNRGKAPCIAIFGTGSDVGKSVVVTAMCRFFAGLGLRVAPYKSQNMSNNSGVTPEGLEMGRAQIVQAEGAGIVPRVDMNPILLKPTSDVGSQVIVNGRVWQNCSAESYHKKKEELFAIAAQALDRLRNEYDLIIIEGAGSCAEVNLMAHDIVNFKIAEYANAPVILVGDIHRGGIFAQITGTLDCIPASYRNLVQGVIINRFRGDISLFQDGVQWIEKKTRKKVLGVLPWYTHIQIEAEDSVVIEQVSQELPHNPEGHLVAVIRLPHIANFNDMDPLLNLKGLDVHFLDRVCDLEKASAIIIPGSKNTRADLVWLHEKGWADAIRAYVDRGGYVFGICAGYQIMGERVIDPEGFEGAPGETQGLSLLPVETVLQAPKTTTLSKFCWQESKGFGYEIHMGYTIVPKDRHPFKIYQRNAEPVDFPDGCISENNRCLGTYIHGFFDSVEITQKWLHMIGAGSVSGLKDRGLEERNKQYDLLAEHLKRHIDTDYLKALVL
jgi:adenosylcobyric acid synthase